MTELNLSDYSLTGADSEKAVERGLASATWYTSPIPREKMRELLMRRDGPAIRDTIIWFGILIASGVSGYLLWGTWWAIIPFAIYGVVYGSSSDSRWHESSHGTAFKTDWMNNLLYEISSFMVMRESTIWRWSHTRHHSDTIIVGRDPEIAVPRPPNIKNFILAFFGVPGAISYIKKIMLHCTGRLDPEGSNLHSEKRAQSDIFQSSNLCADLCGSHWFLFCFWKHTADPVHRLAEFLWLMAHACLRFYPTCRFGGECA